MKQTWLLIGNSRYKKHKITAIKSLGGLGSWVVELWLG